MLAGLFLAGSPAWGSAASAHDSLVSSVPADNAHVAHRPDRVVLVFDEAVAALGTSIVVVAPSGTTVSAGSTAVDGTTASVSLSSATVEESGGYVVRYRVISADGHEVQGSYDFRVGTGGPGPASVVDEPSDRSHRSDLADLADLAVLAVGGLLLAVLAVLATSVTLLTRRRRTVTRTPLNDEE